MKKYLARNHRFYIENSGQWIAISGISEWSVSYQNSIADISKFNENGWTSSITTSRSGVVALDGFYLVDSVTGQTDLGQSICDSLTNSLGYNSLRGFKIEAYDENLNTIGYILASGVFSRLNRNGAVSNAMRWGVTVNFKGIPIGSGIYNIFDQEAYPPPASGIDRAGMWTGVLGMYTYAE